MLIIQLLLRGGSTEEIVYLLASGPSNKQSKKNHLAFLEKKNVNVLSNKPLFCGYIGYS